MNVSQATIGVCAAATMTGIWLGAWSDASAPRVTHAPQHADGPFAEAPAAPPTPPASNSPPRVRRASPVRPQPPSARMPAPQESEWALREARAEYVTAKAEYEADQARYRAERDMAGQQAGYLGAIGAAPMIVQEPDPSLYLRYQQSLRRYQSLGGR